MMKFGVFALIVALCCGVQASWYWPVGSSEVDERDKRVSELIEPASLLIDEASDLAADDKVDEAVAKYRKALSELDRIEMENPERAKKAEFATVRNKRAYVNAAIDSLLLTQVQSNAKAVAVSDTTELEKRLDRERWGMRLDKAREALERRDSATASAEAKKAREGTTNVVLIAMTDIVVAGVACQKGAFEEARRALMRFRQKLVGAGELTAEERNLAMSFLQTVRSGFVDGPAQAVSAGRRACDDSDRLKTMDMATPEADVLANGVAVSLDALQEPLKPLDFPEARQLSRASSNVQRCVSALRSRMNFGEKRPTWNVDVSCLRAALAAFDALSPEIKDVDVGVSAALRTVGAEVQSKKEKNERRKDSNPSQPSQPFLSRRDQTMIAISKGDFKTAERLVGEMLDEKPNGAAALNLKAALKVRQKDFKAAEAALDQAIRSNPGSHFAYYNMANLMLQVKPDDKSVARRYYEDGRKCGGPVDARLEEALK